ncbi:MAG: hypothetical protein KKB63_00595 [Alphaproteobacteria bacterium]|nr:hypothetical protein [Alphaproteobacteria bacterium]
MLLLVALLAARTDAAPVWLDTPRDGFAVSSVSVGLAPIGDAGILPAKAMARAPDLQRRARDGDALIAGWDHSETPALASAADSPACLYSLPAFSSNTVPTFRASCNADSRQPRAPPIS